MDDRIFSAAATPRATISGETLKYFRDPSVGAINNVPAKGNKGGEQKPATAAVIKKPSKSGTITIPGIKGKLISLFLFVTEAKEKSKPPSNRNLQIAV